MFDYISNQMSMIAKLIDDMFPTRIYSIEFNEDEKISYEGHRQMIRSAFLPTSNEPYLSDRPNAAALLIVAAANASSKLI